MASSLISSFTSIWEERYAGEEYLFGTEPNAFLLSQQALLKQGAYCISEGSAHHGMSALIDLVARKNT